MAALSTTCRCLPSCSKLATHGYVCNGQGGNHAHWLCKNCVKQHGRKLSCAIHPQATVVAVRTLWANTRFRPINACATPKEPQLALAASDVVAHHAGQQGLWIRINNHTVTSAMVIELTLAGIAGHRYAVLWPEQPHAWLFPRLSTTSPVQHTEGGPITVLTATWKSAWSHRNTRLLGLPPEYILSIMHSQCARRRWWFVMPQTNPPLIVPSQAATTFGLKEKRPNLLDCGYHATPTVPYSPAYDTDTEGNLKCAWCKTPKPSKACWIADCAPDTAF